MPLTQASTTTERWVTRDVLLIIVAQIVFGLGWSLYLLIPKFLSTALHAGPEVIGRTSAAGGFAGILLVPIAATGIDRFGRRLFFRIGTLLIVFSSIAYLRVREVDWLVYVLQGCVAAAFMLAFSANAALLTDWAPPARVGQAIGWLGGANVCTNAVSTMIAEPLAAQYGWHVVFELGIVLGVLAFALSFATKDAPVRMPLGAPGELPVPRAGLERASRLAPVLVATMLIGSVFAAMFIFVQPYALERGAHEVRAFFIGFTVTAVASRVAIGGLGDRFGHRLVSIGMTLAYGLSAYLTMHLDPDRLWFYGFMFGAAHGLLYPTLNALVFEIVPAHRKGYGMAFYNGAFNVGTTLSSFGWGALAARAGYPAVYASSALLALLAAFVLFASRPSNAAQSTMHSGRSG